MIDHFSHSQLTQYARCAKQYELSRMRFAPQSPSVWLAGGKALHETINWINRAVVAGDVPSDADVSSQWDEDFNAAVVEQQGKTNQAPDQWRRAGRSTKDNPNKEDLHWWRHDGLRQAIAYRDWLTTSGWHVYTHGGVVMSEVEVSADFDGVFVKGYLDSLMVSPDGELVVVDYKSGTREPFSLAQLGQYKVMVKKTIGIDIELGSHFMTRKAQMVEPAVLSRYTDEYFTRMYKNLHRAVTSEVFLPSVGDACRMCDVSAACHAVGGVDAWRYDPDHPLYEAPAEDPVG